VRWADITSALLVFLSLLPAPIFAAAKNSAWSEYTSDHFVVYSDRKPAEARALLMDFERFRNVVLAVTGLRSSAGNTSAQIFLFNRKRDYREFHPDSGVAGYFRDTWQGPRMVVGAEAKLADASLVLFHEYVHHLMREHGQLRYPLWYEEGFADLLAASQLDERQVLIGLVHPWRRHDIDKEGLMPILDLLSPQDTDNPRDWARYYASAWIFMHFLQLGHLSLDKDHRVGMTSLLLAINRDEDPRVSVQKHFGMEPEKIDAQLKAYAERRTWSGYKTEVRPYRGALAERRLSINEAAYLLGDLAYRSGRQETALEWVKRIDAKQPSVARPLSLRAIIEQHLGRLDLAAHVMGLALQTGADDSYVLTNAAHLYWDKAHAKNNHAKNNHAKNNVAPVTEEYLRRAVEHGEKALQLDSGALEAGYFAALAYAELKKADQALALLSDLYRRYPTDVRLNMELGRLLASTKESSRAAPYLQRVIAWDHGQTRRQQAKKLLEHLGHAAPIGSDVDQEHSQPIQINSR
jgi:tetratricopeptide (TPR) repeat protein